MPELPEVQTTVNGLRENVIGLRIKDVWTDYNSPYFKGSETIKDPAYFKIFKKKIIGSKISSIDRRAKNILVHLVQGPTLDKQRTILIHMKMTGHLLYGQYHFNKSSKKDPWEPIEPESLKDPFNRRVHFVISFSNGKFLALSDTRKFAKVTLIEHGSPIANDSSKSSPNFNQKLGEGYLDSEYLKSIGPEPLDKSFTFEMFKSRLKMKPNGKIKQVLMNQAIIAGIGNIYADESLWHANIHPARKVRNIKTDNLQLLFKVIRKTLTRGIDFGGDSMSDYRNIHGRKGEFQEKHHAYQKTGSICDKKGCDGRVVRIMIGNRSTHFCNKHQKG